MQARKELAGLVADIKVVVARLRLVGVSTAVSLNVSSIHIVPPIGLFEPTSPAKYFQPFER